MSNQFIVISHYRDVAVYIHHNAAWMLYTSYIIYVANTFSITDIMRLVYTSAEA